MLLLLNDRLDLPTAGWWRGSFGEVGVSVLLIRQALPDLRHLQRADPRLRVRKCGRHCPALLCEASIFLRFAVCHRRHPLVTYRTNPMTGPPFRNGTQNQHNGFGIRACPSKGKRPVSLPLAGFGYGNEGLRWLQKYHNDFLSRSHSCRCSPSALACGCYASGDLGRGRSVTSTLQVEAPIARPDGGRGFSLAAAVGGLRRRPSEAALNLIGEKAAFRAHRLMASIGNKLA